MFQEIAIEKFFNSFIPEPNSGCWIWEGSADHKGYGRFRAKGPQYRAHRFSYEYHSNEKLGNLLACHKCDTPSCVSPNHLFPGTNKDNSDDKIRKGRDRKSNQGGFKKNTLVGSTNTKAKLSENNVIEIRSLISNNSTTKQEILQKYGIKRVTLNRILKRVTWSHV